MMADGRRWKFNIAYDGTGFKGWERQAQGERTVQGEFEAALAVLTGEETALTGASRTDSGVHALGQVAVADLAARWKRPVLIRALNALTPPDLLIRDAVPVAPCFHPRQGVTKKTYFYHLIAGNSPDPFRDRYAHRLKVLPPLGPLRAAGRFLCGERDFAAMMAAGSSVQSTVRHLSAVRVRAGRGWIRIFFTADGFLYKMIRNMASFMTEIATGAISVSRAERILASRDRSLAPPTFPGKGLFLWRIRYNR
jgi:tRNA pseudouridine38-40 synthase